MRFCVAAALAMLAGAVGCSGRTTVRAPVLDLEYGEPTEPDGYVVEGLRAPPDGALSLTIGGEPAPEPGTDPAESAVDQSEDRPAHDLEAAGSSPAPATPEPGLREIADIVLSAVQAGADTALAAVRAGADATRSGMDAAAALLAPAARAAGPAPEEPGSVGPPTPAPENGPPVVERAELREFMGADKGGFDAVQEAEAEAAARGVLGEDGFDALARPRQDAWIALCHYLACSTLTYARTAALAGDWTAAAGDIETRIIGTLGIGRAERLAGWLRTGKR